MLFMRQSKQNLASPSAPFLLCWNRAPPPAEKSAQDSGPSQYHIQVSELDLMSEVSPGSGLAGLEASVRKNGVVSLLVTFFLSASPPSLGGPSCPGAGRRTQGTGLFLPGWGLWMAQQ